MTKKATILDEIEKVMDLAGMSASRFGYLCVGDPAFVNKLRGGRVMRDSTAKKVALFMDNITRGDVI